MCWGGASQNIFIVVIIGIVGGVASGKSFVASQLESLGARRIDADALGHEVLRDPQVKVALVDRWGAGVVDQEGEIDRGAVANIVFAAAPQGPRELAFLEAMTHTRIAAKISERIQAWAAQQNVPAVVLDAAVLLKAGWIRLCDYVLYVDAPRQLRLERALARGWDEREFSAREAAQESLRDKRAHGDFVIDNAGSPAQTSAQVQQFWETLDNGRTPDH